MTNKHEQSPLDDSQSWRMTHAQAQYKELKESDEKWGLLNRRVMPIREVVTLCDDLMLVTVALEAEIATLRGRIGGLTKKINKLEADNG